MHETVEGRSIGERREERSIGLQVIDDRVTVGLEMHLDPLWSLTRSAEISDRGGRSEIHEFGNYESSSNGARATNSRPKKKNGIQVPLCTCSIWGEIHIANATKEKRKNASATTIRRKSLSGFLFMESGRFASANCVGSAEWIKKTKKRKKPESQQIETPETNNDNHNVEPLRIHFRLKSMRGSHC